MACKRCGVTMGWCDLLTCPRREPAPRPQLKISVEAAVAAERERCAALCELWNTAPGSALAKEIRKTPNAQVQARPSDSEGVALEPVVVRQRTED